jgi:2-phospho-L-lactate/phosphoenolpyruvate guanylyltransferase
LTEKFRRSEEETPVRALLLPLKEIRNAKKRLAGILSAEERQGLAQAMAEDVLHAVREVRRADRIFLVTNEETAIRAAEAARWEVIREDKQISESASVDFASRWCEERGVTSLLRLPLDLPLVQPGDIDALLALEITAPACAMVPSRDGTGTNALLRTPPTLFASQFGEGSFAKHRAAAERAGALVLLMRNPRLELDVDDPADLRALLRHNLSGTATGRWLGDSGIAERVLSAAHAAPAN